MIKLLVLLVFFLGMSGLTFSFCLRHQHSPSHQGRISFVLVLWSLLTALLLGEVYFSYFFAESASFGPLSQNFIKKYYTIDAYGFRDSGLPPSDNQPNIIILGDSFVFGQGIKNVNDRAANIIRNHFPNAHTLVLAQPGIGTVTEKKFYETSTQSTPPVQWVILNHFYNDMEDVIPPGVVSSAFADTDSSILKNGVAWLKDYSSLATFIYYNFLFSMDGKTDKYQKILNSAYQTPAYFAAHLHDLKQFQDEVKQKYPGAQFVVVLWPILKYPHEAPNTHIAYDASYRQLMAGLQQANVAYIDLVPALSPHTSDELVVNPMDSHPNEIANAIAARVIIDYMAHQK